MKAQGLVHKYGSNVDTDVIIPARYLNTANHKELAAHCMEAVSYTHLTSPVAINEFERCGADSVFDKSKISLVMDHFVPNKDIKSAEHTKQVRTLSLIHICGDVPLRYDSIGKRR